MAHKRDIASLANELSQLGAIGRKNLTDDQVTLAIKLLPTFFRTLLTDAEVDERPARALTTKFRDAGRRSAPWKAFSGRVAGRPQDGADGNRINRWLLPEDHKQYATQREATLVEIAFYMQALSLKDCPAVPHPKFSDNWRWVTGRAVLPGQFKDPVQLRDISILRVLETPRMITSGHIYPLDRGGKHELGNVFLVLHRSNQMQGNMTLPEFLQLSDFIVTKHREEGTFPHNESKGLLETIDYFDSPHG